MSLMRVKSDNWRNIAVNDFSGWHKVKLLCLCPSFEFKFNKLRSQLNLLFKMCQAEQEILAIIKQIFLCKFKWRDFMTELKVLPYYQYQVTTHSSLLVTPAHQCGCVMQGSLLSTQLSEQIRLHTQHVSSLFVFKVGGHSPSSPSPRETRTEARVHTKTSE